MEVPQHDLAHRNASWWRWAEGLTASCFELWASSATGLAPEFSKAPWVMGRFRWTGTVPSHQVSSKAPHKFVEAGSVAMAVFFFYSVPVLC